MTRQRSRGLAAAGMCAAMLGIAPGAQASQGSDSISRGDHISYIADPGEANRLLVEDWAGGGLHLNDSGAIIRWLGAPVPGVTSCTAAVHDAYCVDGGGYAISVDLGDGDDTYTATAQVVGTVDLGPGDDVAHGGPLGYEVEGGPGADDLYAGDGDWGDTASYEHATGPVRADPDNVADDGQAGEGDNIHSGFESVIGGPFDDRLSGFAGMYGGPGNDLLVARAAGSTGVGGPGDDTFVGGAGPDYFNDVEDPSGSNTIYVRGGGADRVVCGGGYDRVFADASDTIASAPACEEVSIG